MQAWVADYQSMVLDIVNSSIKLGLEVAVMVLAEHFLVGHSADAFTHLTPNLCLER